MRRSSSGIPLPLLILAAGALYLLYLARGVLLPFVLSLSLAYLLDPLVQFFQARGLRRDRLVLSLYLAAAALVTITANSVLPALTSQLALLQARFPLYLNHVQKALHGLEHQAIRGLPMGQEAIEASSARLYDSTLAQVSRLPSYALSLFPFLSLTLLVPFITFFLLSDSDDMMQKAIQLCPSRYVEQALHLLSEVDTSLGNYLRGVMIVALAIGFASFIGLLYLGVDHALAIAALAGISSLIPYLGAVLGAAVGALAAFFQFHKAKIAFQVVLLFLGIRLGDEILLEPLVSKHTVRLHPLVFLSALLIGGNLFGFIGLLFAVPAACVLKALALVAWDWYASESRIKPPQPVPDAAVPYC